MTTTTITPQPKTSITYTATLLSPLHHGAGSKGNTQVLRTREVVQPDQSLAQIPYVSAASLRHALRDRLAWHLADTIGIEPGSLAKVTVDQLWTGGAVTSTGAETDLDLIRRVDQTLPMLTLLGFAAKSDIYTGTLRASDLMLICTESAQALRINSQGLRSIAAYRGEEFGTRHDQANSPAGRMIACANELVGAPVKTTQMIWDTQVVLAGAQMRGQFTLTPGATRLHQVVLGAALALWAPGGEAHIGAKTASGYGHVRIDGIGDRSADLTAWTDHLAAHADEVHALLAELAK